jgi:hypothetical protein
MRRDRVNQISKNRTSDRLKIDRNGEKCLQQAVSPIRNEQGAAGSAFVRKLPGDLATRAQQPQRGAHTHRRYRDIRLKLASQIRADNCSLRPGWAQLEKAVLAAIRPVQNRHSATPEFYGRHSFEMLNDSGTTSGNSERPEAYAGQNTKLTEW